MSTSSRSGEAGEDISEHQTVQKGALAESCRSLFWDL